MLLLLTIAGALSNGLEQYLMFQNANNKEVIEVLDLYVYNIGIDGGDPLSTVIGMAKSLISITLLLLLTGYQGCPRRRDYLGGAV